MTSELWPPDRSPRLGVKPSGAGAVDGETREGCLTRSSSGRPTGSSRTSRDASEWLARVLLSSTIFHASVAYEADDPRSVS
jgi:hypothetical protein